VHVKNQVESQVGVSIPIEYFFLQDIIFPDAVLTNSLNSVMQIQNNLLQQITQEVAVVIAVTNTKVSEIEAQANYVVSFSEIQATQLVANSNSYAANMAIKARNLGIATVANSLGIINPEDIDKFVKIMSLYEANTPKIIFGSVNTILSTN